MPERILQNLKITFSGQSLYRREATGYFLDCHARPPPVSLDRIKVSSFNMSDFKDGLADSMRRAVPTAGCRVLRAATRSILRISPAGETNVPG